MAAIKHKKVIQVQPIKVEEKPVKYWIYKIPNPLYLSPTPYAKQDLTKEIIKLLKFCKNGI